MTAIAIQDIDDLDTALEEIRRLNQLVNYLTTSPTLDRLFGLTKSESRIVYTLAKTGFIRNDAIEALLWGADADGGPNTPTNTIKVFISRIRKRFRDLNFTIIIEPVIGVGYQLDSESKQELRDRLTYGFGIEF